MILGRQGLRGNDGTRRGLRGSGVRRGYLSNPIPPAPPNLNTNLISFWKLGEATGADRDDSIDSNTLTNNGSGGGVSQVSGLGANASSFASANSQHLSIASNASLQTGTAAFHHVIWVKLNSTAVSMAILSKDAGTASGRNLRWQNSTLSFFWLVRQSSGADCFRIAMDTVVNDTSTWHMIDCYWDGTNGGIRLDADNGTLDTAVGTGTPANETNPFYIGRDGSGSVGMASATMQACGWWQGLKLTDEKIALLYNSGTPLMPPF